MKLQHQIALALRHRPLVLPMLVATICLDVLGFVQLAIDPHATDNFGYRFFLLGQSALLAFWTTCQVSFWSLRLSLALLGLCLFSLDYHRLGLQLNSLSIYLAYYTAVLVIDLIGRLHRLVREGSWKSLPRFGVRHLLTVMTITATVVATTRSLIADNWNTIADDFLLFAILLSVYAAVPFLCAWIVRKTQRTIKSNGLAFLYCLMAAGLVGFCLSRFFPHFLHELVLHPPLSLAFVCSLWFIAAATKADPKRRLAARRKRRAPKLTIFSEAVAADIEAETISEPAPATRIDAEA